LVSQVHGLWRMEEKAGYVIGKNTLNRDGVYTAHGYLGAY